MGYFKPHANHGDFCPPLRPTSAETHLLCGSTYLGRFILLQHINHGRHPACQVLNLAASRGLLQKDWAISHFLPTGLRKYLLPYQLLGAPDIEMTSVRTKVGHGLAKFFNIELQKPQPYEDEVTRGESVYSTDTFVEEPPTAGEYFRELTPSGKEVFEYIKSLFPFLYWIGKYNMQWLAGDLVAGESSALPESVTHDVNNKQVLPSAPSWSPRVWAMPRLQILSLSLACTRRSWAS